VRINNALTLPFSNLLTLFLLINMSLSPVSPRSPMTLRKTLASVPLPLTLPVQMVTRYFITRKKHKGRGGHSHEAPTCTQSLSICTEFALSRFLTGQRLFDELSGGREFSDDLIVVLVDVQPTATFKRIFLHRQGLEQSDLQRATSSCVIKHVFISGS